MHFTSCSLLLPFAATALAVPLNLGTVSLTNAAINSGLALKGLNALAVADALTRFKPGQGCNPSKLKLRQEWRTISKPRRKQFIAAVKCVASKPSILQDVPAALNQYDDLVWAHAKRADFIHASGYFFPYHRYFIQVFEDAIKDCGWDGGLPYWEWGLDVNSPHLSPVFDGSDTSLGSDGAFIPNRPSFTFVPPNHNVSVTLTPGTGGGCVDSGPFRQGEWTVNLGPYADDLTGVVPADPELPPNPRCMTRDLSAQAIQQWNSLAKTTRQILDHDNIRDFQGTLDGDIRVTPIPVQVHGGAHIAIAGIGGTAGDVRISPNDPAFWLTHANLDRVWWIWQHLDFENRQDVWGTKTWMNRPPSADVTVNDTLEVLPHAPARKVKDLMNTVGGTPFCYVYV
ncbi:Grixazone synthase [Cladorrhinum sp. PSN259]|nr:Grixazone synthase [Cladorrhinum sp. PSN259]